MPGGVGGGGREVFPYPDCVVDLYNGSRPHMALGPGVPDPPATPALTSKEDSGLRLGGRLVVRARSVLGGLHHDYFLVEPRA